VAAVDILTQALKATFLVVLLSFAWAMPAGAHPGHGATPRAEAAAAKPVPQVETISDAAASDRSLRTEPCAQAANGGADAAGIPAEDGAQGRPCCGTMCTVALIEHGGASPPLRRPHAIRREMPPAAFALVKDPSPDARPPRTIDIA
jgi:hypothetical protein